MKSATIVAGLLASVAMAQPHRGHRHQHQKKDVVVEWVTEWETVTEIVDDTHTETVFPVQSTTAPVASTTSAAPSPSSTISSSSSSEAAAKFFETPVPSSSSPLPVVIPSSSASSSQAPVEVPTSTFVAPPPAQTTAVPETTPLPQTTAAPVAPAAVESSTSVAPAPAATSASTGGTSSTSSTSSGSSTFSGEITYYVMGPTACGDDFTGQDKTVNVVALPYGYMGTASSYGPGQPANEYCGKTIKITANGKSTTAKVQDKCMGCSAMDIDVSESVFLELFGSTDGGRLECDWSFA